MKPINFANIIRRYPARFFSILIALVLCFGVGLPLVSDATGKEYVPPKTVENYSQLYTALVRMKIKGNNYLNQMGWEKEATGAPTTDNVRNIEYSQTNLQVAGVQEADIIKTDGSHIYAVSNRWVFIVAADNGEMKLVSKIERKDPENTQSQAVDILVYNNVLAVISSRYSYSTQIKDESNKPAIGIYQDYASTMLELYDIADTSNVKLVETFTQSGYYMTSRMVEDKLYLATNHGIYAGINKNQPESFVPGVYAGDDVKLVSPEDIRIGENNQNANYTVVSGFDVDNPKLISTKALLGYGSIFYATTKNLYIASEQWVTQGNSSFARTNITRLSLNDGAVKVAAEGEVPGSLLNQFSMDEYKGMLRVVTTTNSYSFVPVEPVNPILPEYRDEEKAVPPQPPANDGSERRDAVPPEKGRDIAITKDTWESGNALYILDANLEIKGKIEDLAKGERVYSVRFMGDTVYFVTFKRIDPLFAVDLSDPARPVVLSELKIPGFSNCLYPYKDGLLLGLGQDGDEEGNVGFLKLSMFDTTNPSNVKEINKYVMDKVYYSEASYNHKAILIDGEKNLIAFQGDGAYYIFGYSSSGFVFKAKLTLPNEFYYYAMRGLYIEDELYLFGYNTIASYSLADFERIDTLMLFGAEQKHPEPRPRTAPAPEPGDKGEVAPSKR